MIPICRKHNKQRNYSFLFAGQTVSVLGDWLSYVVTPILVYNIKQSPIDIGLLMLCRSLPGIILPLFIGKILKKASLLKTMIACDAIRGVLFLGFIFADSTYQFLGLTLIIYSCSAIFNPAKYSIIPSILSGETIPKANGYLSSVENFSMLIGPAIGGILFALVGVNWIIIFNSITFFVSMTFLLKIKYVAVTNVDGAVDAECNKDSFSLVEKIKEQVRVCRIVVGNKKIFNLLVSNSLDTLAFGSLNALMPLIANNIFNEPSIVYGYLMTALGGGLLFGSMLFTKIYNRMSSYCLFSSATLVAAISFISLGVSNTLVVSLLAIFILGIGNGVQEVTIATLIQQSCDSENEVMLIFSTNQAMVSICAAITMVFSTVTIYAFGIKLTFVLLGIIPFILGLVLLLSSKLYIDA
jgi:MFS family permease